MKLRDIMRSKGEDVVTIQPDAPVHDAMRLLVRHNIGALVVQDGEIKGIFTERDLLRAGAEDLDRLARDRVRDLMTADVITIHPDADLQEVMRTMTERRIRHLPVVEDGALRGIVSIGDVVNALRRDKEEENQQLHAYISGVRA
jgi:CBS domain-containing protein